MWRACIRIAIATQLGAVIFGDDEQHVGFFARAIFGRDADDVFQLHALESHMRAAAFVENADGLVIDHRQARVARAAPFIEEQL